MLKLFFKTENRLRAISFVVLFMVIFAGILLPQTASADSAPEWLRAAAQDKLPDYPKETVAVILLNDQQTTVKDNGEIETHIRRAYKLLRPEARDSYGGISVHFNNETKISCLKAWTITSNGQEIEVKDKDAVEVRNDKLRSL